MTTISSVSEERPGEQAKQRRKPGLTDMPYHLLDKIGDELDPKSLLCILCMLAPIRVSKNLRQR